MIVVSSSSESQSHALRRTLSIDPTSRGFGYVVLEGSDRLIDWGVVHIRRDKETGCLRRIERMIDFHKPSLVVTEDTTGTGSRRCKRVAQLIEGIGQISRQRGVLTTQESLAAVRRFFSQFGLADKKIQCIAMRCTVIVHVIGSQASQAACARLERVGILPV